MFVELVCGPAGCGKTTYCEGKRQLLGVCDPLRPVVMMNFDPANEGIFPYPCDVDIRAVVSHREAVQSEQLGPNGGYLLCADIISARLVSIFDMIGDVINRKVCEVGSGKPPYIIIDSPGQVEFFHQSTCVDELLHYFQKRLSATVCMTHLLDAAVATRGIDAYVANCLLVLSLMTRFELPQVNFLSKWDTISPDDAEEYLSVSNVLESFNLLARQHRRPPSVDHLTRALLTVVDGYSIVGFHPLSVESQESMHRAAVLVDTALGIFCS